MSAQCPEICCEPIFCPPCDPCIPTACPPMRCDPCCPPIQCDPCCPPTFCKPCPPKRCKSRELRSSILMLSCDCVKRNGLQYNCPRKECNGRPCCTTKPFPSCCPSRYTWRYSNVTFGKPTNPRPTKQNCKPVLTNCNPCVAVNCDDCCTDCC